MNSRISLFFSVCFFLCASCASEPQPAPRSGYEPLVQEEVEREEPSPAVDKTVPPPTPATQQGPIDLGLGDEEELNGASIVINRPDNHQVDLGDDEDAPETSKTYERNCEEIEHCEGLEEPECDGEMQCAENQCVYTCQDSDGGDESGGDESGGDESESGEVHTL